jgi:hypothetical protein
MTRSLLIVAASLMVASTAWAVDAPSQPGGGNNVGAQFKSTPAPTPASAPAPGIADHAGPINAPIQPGGGNNVNAQFSSTPAPTPAPAATPAPNMSHAAFNPHAYNNASECMTAAAAAQQPLGPCEALNK